MKFNDAIIGIVVALFGAAVVSQSWYFPRAQHIPYGPGFLPTLLGFGLIACGLVLIVGRLAAGNREALLALGDWARSRRHVTGFVLVLASLGFYVVLADDIGHFASSVVILFVLVGHLSRRPLYAFVVAVLASVAIQMFFVQVLLVPLPWGVLEPYAGWLTWR
jgi:putative tricarboxylic transport membrane protein